MRLLRRTLIVAAGLLLGLALLAAVPVVWIETSCPVARQSAPPQASRLPPEERRNPVDTYLTYPEWSIVHAYEDFAAVAARQGEAAFDYTGSVLGYWRNFCRLYGEASREGTVSGEVRAMLHIIGLSFSAEMAVKGAYEETVGRISHLLGGRGSAEDRFADRLNGDYAAFLRQTPWYEFPFATRLQSLWRDVPLGEGGIFRSFERRMALSLEYGVKALYAQALGAMASLAPAKLTMQSVVRDFEASDIAADPRITLLRRDADGAGVIETPRYRAFTEIVVALSDRGRTLDEIAGNRTILATVISAAGRPPVVAGAREVFRVPVQSLPGGLRQGLVVEVDAIGSFLRALKAQGAALEQFYDY
jgi:hypothetical protein